MGEQRTSMSFRSYNSLRGTPGRMFIQFRAISIRLSGRTYRLIPFHRDYLYLDRNRVTSSDSKLDSSSRTLSLEKAMLPTAPICSFYCNDFRKSVINILKYRFWSLICLKKKDRWYDRKRWLIFVYRHFIWFFHTKEQKIIFRTVRCYICKNM